MGIQITMILRTARDWGFQFVHTFLGKEDAYKFLFSDSFFK